MMAIVVSHDAPLIRDIDPRGLLFAGDSNVSGHLLIFN